MTDLDKFGFQWVRRALDSSSLARLAGEVERLCQGQTHGMRGLLQRSSLLAEAARNRFGLTIPVQDLVCLRGILFDKPAQANWRVPWHRDLTMALPRRVDAPGFSSWTIKEGVPHAQPPREFLEQVVTMRLHLDAADCENGALRVMPGSHRDGKEMPECVDREAEKLLEAQPGDVLLMRPLLLHASSPSKSGRPRRVLHFDYVPRAALPQEMLG